MGFVFQAFNLILNLTILENVLPAGYLVSKNGHCLEKKPESCFPPSGSSIWRIAFLPRSPAENSSERLWRGH